MKVVEATIEDAEEILALQKEAYQSEAELHNDWNIPPLKQTLEEIRAEFSEKLFVKVESNGMIVGSGRADYRDGACFIGRLIVRPEHRGKGIGSKILEHLEEHYFEANRFEVFTGEKSVNNIEMYKKRGYKPYKTEAVGPTKIIFMTKDHH